MKEVDKVGEMVRIFLGPMHYSDHLPVSPACFETFQLLHKKSFKHFCTLKKRCIVGVVIAAVVKDFGHVSHKLCQFMVMSLLQARFHCGKIYKGQENMNMDRRVHFSSAKFILTHWLLDNAVIIWRIMRINRFKERPCHFVRLLKRI